MARDLRAGSRMIMKPATRGSCLSLTFLLLVAGAPACSESSPESCPAAYPRYEPCGTESQQCTYPSLYPACSAGIGESCTCRSGAWDCTHTEPCPRDLAVPTGQDLGQQD